MKKILILFLFFATSSFAQVKAPDTDFVLQYAKVFWEHSYESDLSSAELIAQLTERLKSDPRNSEPSVVGNTIRFSVDNDKPNIKKYGAKEMKTSIIAKLYLKYDAVIEVKDNAYSVKLTNIFLDNKDRTERNSGDITKYVCNTSNLTFKTDEGVQQGMRYVNRHLTEKYDLTKPLEDIPAKK